MGYYLPSELAKLAGCRPQMIYNYMRAGTLPRKQAEHNGRTHYVVPCAEADAWLEKYLERKAKRYERK